MFILACKTVNGLNVIQLYPPVGSYMSLREYCMHRDEVLLSAVISFKIFRKVKLEQISAHDDQKTLWQET